MPPKMPATAADTDAPPNAAPPRPVDFLAEIRRGKQLKPTTTIVKGSAKRSQIAIAADEHEPPSPAPVPVDTPTKKTSAAGNPPGGAPPAPPPPPPPPAASTVAANSQPQPAPAPAPVDFLAEIRRGRQLKKAPVTTQKGMASRSQLVIH
jgi:hypothetical protein